MTAGRLLLLLLACLAPGAAGRLYCAMLNVSNGGTAGEWGRREFCPFGYADGFSVKLETHQGFLPGQDDTALNGIRLHCAQGGNVTSSVGRWGTWSHSQSCPKVPLVAFQLQTEPWRLGRDNTAANSLRMKCERRAVLEARWEGWGAWGPWSPRCPRGYICGLQTRVQPPRGAMDDTALNDARFFCCC
ncbi:vitelline membrane outer layer protein 1-like [Hemicordylus capensis]|uniref:vitelline membrane outer layer protein 1-like n=1 Tax=Hemicordylus capensis TaxID=884348 RepID=UPI0023038C0D|nr:vitelline membrane outer layer protein 1-like [Hemicordylus capensis]